MVLFPFGKTLYEAKSGDSTVQVIQKGGKRELRFGNHIVQAAVSDQNPNLLLLQYTQAMMIGLIFVETPTRILHVGLGAGALARVIHQVCQEGAQVVVELLPEVVEVAYRYFHLPVSPRLEVVRMEGAAFLQQDQRKHHLIFLDAYQADGVAEHLKTRAFFLSVRDRLEPGGWVVNNVWGSDRANLNMVTATLAGVFPQLFSVSVGADSNIIFFAGRQESVPPSPSDLMQRAARLSGKLDLDLNPFISRLTKVQASLSTNAAKPPI